MQNHVSIWNLKESGKGHVSWMVARTYAEPVVAALRESSFLFIISCSYFSSVSRFALAGGDILRRLHCKARPVSSVRPSASKGNTV